VVWGGGLWVGGVGLGLGAPPHSRSAKRSPPGQQPSPLGGGPSKKKSEDKVARGILGERLENVVKTTRFGKFSLTKKTRTLLGQEEKKARGGGGKPQERLLKRRKVYRIFLKVYGLRTGISGEKRGGNSVKGGGGVPGSSKKRDDLWVTA